MEYTIAAAAGQLLLNRKTFGSDNLGLTVSSPSSQ